MKHIQKNSRSTSSALPMPTLFSGTSLSTLPKAANQWKS